MRNFLVLVPLKFEVETQHSVQVVQVNEYKWTPFDCSAVYSTIS